MKTPSSIVLLAATLLPAACTGPSKSSAEGPPTVEDEPRRSSEPTPGVSPAPETRVRPLPLGPGFDVAAQAEAELSGLAWDLERDRLILLPEEAHSTGELLAVKRSELAAVIRGERPRARVESIALELTDKPAGIDGLESIAIDGDHVWFTVEMGSEEDFDGFLVAGAFDRGGTRVVASFEPRRRMPAATTIGNMSFEAVLVVDSGVVGFYEANGALARHRRPEHEHPRAFEWGPKGLELRRTERLLPVLEYRLTDVTAVRGERFWGINYLYPKEHQLVTLADPIAERAGRGATHAESAQRPVAMIVERLVAFERDAGTGELSLAPDPPIQLDLRAYADGSLRRGGELRGHNWEGIVRWDDPPGFLLVADQYGPAESLLAFVPRRAGD